MFCPNCGTNNEDGVAFCANCGCQLDSQQPQQDVPPQAPYQQPQNGYQPPYVPTTPIAQPGKGLAVAALVLGIISFLCFPIVTGTLGIILGCVAKSKGYIGGMATAGIVCGAIGLALWVLMLIVGFGSILPF